MPASKGEDGRMGADGRGKAPASRKRTRKKAEPQPTAGLIGAPPERILEITCHAASPSANQWVYKHWRAYHSIKKQWLDRLTLATLPIRLDLRQPFEACILTIERRGCRQLDNDNLVAGFKPIIDSLIALGIVVNDTPDIITRLEPKQTKVARMIDQQTLITVIELS